MISLPIPLPDGFIPTIQQGSIVVIGQTIASKHTRPEEVINIPALMAVKRSGVKSVLRKNPGDSVEKGEIIAIKKSLFGAKNIILRSKVAGIITRFERDSGNLVIKTSTAISTEAENLISPVEGTAILCNNEEIVISTDKDVLLGDKAGGASGQGEVFQLEMDDPYHLDARTIGKVVVGGKFTREMLLKGIGIGVVGLVGTEINEEDLKHIAEKNFQIPIIQISGTDKSHLIEWTGKKVFMDSKAKSIIFLHS